MSNSVEKRTLSFWENTVAGGLSAMAAVPFIKPLIYAKNQSQGNAPISKNPFVWYRGGLGFAASFLPTVAAQTAANGVLKKHCDPLIASAGAGAFCAFVVGPAELLMIQQEKTGKSYVEVTRDIVTRFGVRGLFKGLFPTMVREGSFAAGYLGLVPMIRKMMQERGYDETTSLITASVVGGTVPAVVSQPFDTAKTRIQLNVSEQIPTFQEIFKRSSFAGLRWRAPTMIAATTIIPATQGVVQKFMGG